MLGLEVPCEIEQQATSPGDVGAPVGSLQDLSYRIQTNAQLTWKPTEVMALANISSILRKALSELKMQRGQLNRQIAAVESALVSLRRRTDRGATTVAKQVRKRTKRAMSAAQRRAVSERMKRYWAKRRTVKR